MADSHDRISGGFGRVIGDTLEPSKDHTIPRGEYTIMMGVDHSTGRYPDGRLVGDFVGNYRCMYLNQNACCTHLKGPPKSYWQLFIEWLLPIEPLTLPECPFVGIDKISSCHECAHRMMIHTSNQPLKKE